MKNILKSFIDFVTQKKYPNELDDSNWLKKLVELQKKIGYDYRNLSLLKAALTHNSFLRKIEPEGAFVSPFERMEFLGDSVLGMVVAQELFVLYPDKQEGTLSKIKSKLVSEKYLGIKAMDLKLGEYLMLSEEESRNGGRVRRSTLSDAMESLICSLYLDGGYKVASNFIHQFILVDFQRALDSEELTNYKSILQEFTQSKFQKPPEYVVVSEDGPDHKKVFGMNVVMNNEIIGYGVGPSKKEAQQNAARDACQRYELC